MSRIRVYDLAKEAGMASKELADKLIALGYGIKSHSSTVDDDTADEIRRNVLGTVETEVVEKRISTKGRATIIRRRSQTVRRAPEPASVAEEKEEVPSEEEAAETEAVEEPAAKPAKKKVARKKKKDAAAAAPAEEQELAEAEITGEEAEKAPAPEIEALEAEEAGAEEEAEEEPVAGEEKKEEEKPKTRTVKRIVPPRKGLAKVIKKAAIQVPEEKPKPAARPARGKAKVAASPAKGEPMEPDAESRGGKGKKKGKRLVQFRSESEDRGDRFKKGFGGKRRDRRGFGLDGEYD